jgi:hypothetical protein
MGHEQPGTNLLPLPGIEPRFLGFPARSLVTILAQLLISQWCRLRTRQPMNRCSILPAWKKSCSSSQCPDPQAQWLQRPLSAREAYSSYRFSPYLTGNTLRLYYKAHPVNAV